MRPLHLKFAGIGSYPHLVEINFNDLSAMGLFLIVGRTGAGKTTIFDAMTYALYGKVAGERENAIVSGHSGREHPFIEFTFEHAGITYVAHREPALPGKNAATNRQWISTLGSDGHEVNRITQTRQVNEKIKDIIGLSAEEFMQVILLPQGKFQQFLVAKTNDKKGMLQAIFGTGSYRRIVERMLNNARDLQQELANDTEEISNQWAIVGNAHNTLINESIFDDLPDYQNETDEFISLVKKRAAETAAEAKESSEQFAAAKTALAQANLEADRFEKAEQRDALQKEQAAQAKHVDKATKAVDQHVAASPIANSVSTRTSLLKEIDALAQQEKTARASAKSLTEKIKISSEQLKKFADAIPTASPSTLSSEYSKVANFVTSAAEKFDDLEEATSEMKGLEEAIAELTDDQKEKTTSVEAIRKDLVAKRKELEASHKATRELGPVSREVEKLDELIEKADEKDAMESLKKATKLREKRQSAFDKLVAELKSAHEKRTKQLAGELATNLTSGDECPVCGSTDHPKKAKKTAGSVDIDELTDKRDNQFELVKDAEQQLKDATKAVKEAKAAQEKLPSSADQKALRKKYEELTSLSEAADDLKDECDELESLEKDTAAELAEIKNQITAGNTSLRASKRRVDSLTKETTAIGTAKQVEDAAELLNQIADVLADLEEAVTDTGKKQGQLNQVSEDITKALAETSFATEKAAIAAVLEPDALAALKELISIAADRTILIGQLTAAIGNTPLPKSRPDLADLAEKVQKATDANTAAQHRNGIVSTELQNIIKAYKAIVDIGPAYEQKKKQVQQALTMAKIFKDGTSTAAGNQLDLETWVLRTLFEEVCLVANGQMQKLSNNRYTLTLEQEEGGVARRRGGGLDIYVLDAQTGLTRPVQTMSGGEQFIASLSLALALAEVVQRHAGGIEVPCLFIDEGFGGLDLETLDLAIAVLHDIQATGRSVGVITHVETMQQQLPIGIRITKGHNGSTLEVLAS
jgi:exonuclease SbcC